MLRAPFSVLLVSLSLIGAPARAEDCYADWGIAADIVRRQNLRTVSELTQTAARELPGQIVKTTLCKDGDDYIYKLVVRDAKGQLRSVVLDASKSAAPAGK